MRERGRIGLGVGKTPHYPPHRNPHSSDSASGQGQRPRTGQEAAPGFPDKVSTGTVSISSSITDERPDVSEVYDYKNREEYQAWVEKVEAREELSPSERQDIIDSAPVPDETYEEALERHADD
jgi:hypothetical protein